MIERTGFGSPSSFRRQLHAVGIVACTFFYFLIFAQFAFLHRIENLDADKNWLQSVMLLMGVGGTLGCLVAWWLYRRERIRILLAASFFACSLVAFAVGYFASIPLFLFLGFSLGLSLGCLTVSVAVYLSLSLPSKEVAMCSAWGTGLAYFFSNVPWLFEQPASWQCNASGFFALGGFVLILMMRGEALHGEENEDDPAMYPIYGYGKGLWGVVGVFFILVWLDSAAFYVIQETDSLKGASWGSELQLWGHAALHLAAALVSGLLLIRSRLMTVLFAAGAFLITGILWLKIGYNPTVWIGASLYVCGVSLYSAALVSFAALSGKRGKWTVVQRAAVLFGISGWIASGMGIGMARDLGVVPYSFLLVAVAALVAISLFLRRMPREVRL